MNRDMLRKIAKVAYVKPCLLRYYTCMDMWVSHKYKFLYAEIPKVASSSIVEWFATIHNLKEPSEESMRRYIVRNMRAGCLSPKEFRNVWQSYLKFALVRNPWNRLASAFCFLFIAVPQRVESLGSDQKVSSYKQNYLPLLEQVSRFHNKEEGRSKGISFRELVEYIEGTKKNSDMNRHLRPQISFAKPEFLDMIIKLEEVDVQQKLLLDKLGIQKSLPKKNATTSKTERETKEITGRYSDISSDYFRKKNIKPAIGDLYDRTLVQKVESRYRSDIVAFSYSEWLKQIVFVD